jgi:molybdopterin-guanine dinucleotide biosynthesis protein A
VYDRAMRHDPSFGVTAFILAGGKSRRMGTDKAFMAFEGRTLLSRALDTARSVTADVLIVGNHEKFAAFAPVVEDVFRDCGPLGGIHAALRASTRELNLMLAVDMPFVSWAFLEYLIGQARSAGDAAVVVPCAGGRWQPLCAIYRRQFAEAAENALRAGRNKVDLLFEAVPCRTLTEQELNAAGFSHSIFRNLNTPEELESEMRRV